MTTDPFETKHLTLATAHNVKSFSSHHNLIGLTDVLLLFL